MRWSDIESLYVEDLEAHAQACAAQGLVCPRDVFEQLFHDHHEDAVFAAELLEVDWARVDWNELWLSGVKLRFVAVPRGHQYVVDEARAESFAHGICDARPEVIASWQTSRTWMRAPVLLEGPVRGLSVELEMRVGFTRLGDLLGMLDRREVSEVRTHRTWVGELRI
jgi:hypothetical protein